MKLGVVIVTYNRLELLKQCISACVGQTYRFEKIFVINNASTDGTKQYLDSLNYENVEIINSNENLGGAGGFYVGIENATKYDLDYLLLIDDDAILDCNYNQEIAKHMKENSGIQAFSGTVKTNEEIQFEHRRYLKKGFKCVNSTQEEYEKEFFDYDLSTFCGLYISMNVIRKIGLPCKEFFIWFDDTEYSLRISKYSQIRNVNKAWLNHKTTIANAKGFTWKSYYSLRNQIFIIKKYFSKFTLFKYILSMYLMIIGGKFMKVLKNDLYYNKISNMYKDALQDGLNNQMGKNNKYVPGVKFEKK